MCESALCVNQTRPHCVNQMGKPLAERHGICESALTISNFPTSQVWRQNITDTVGEARQMFVGVFRASPSFILPATVIVVKTRLKDMPNGLYRPCKWRHQAALNVLPIYQLARRHIPYDSQSVLPRLKIQASTRSHSSSSFVMCTLVRFYLRLAHWYDACV
jgi:hypothetical protein